MQGQPTVFPPGYPLLIEWLLYWDVASTAVIVVLNLFFLICGIGAYYFLARLCFPEISSVAVLAICGFTSINWILVKHAPLPLTDVPYFGLAMLSLLVIELARRTTAARKALTLFCLVVGLLFAAIAMRSIGVALLPSLILGACLWQRGQWHLSDRSVWQMLTAVGVVTLATIALIAWWQSTSMVYNFPSAASAGNFLELILQSIQYHLIELGEMVSNAPVSKITLLRGAPGIALGAVTAALLIVGFLRRKRFGVCEAYLFAYAAIVAVWPYYDPRFLLPVIPLLISYLYLGLSHLVMSHWLKPIVVIWATAYFAAGTVALGYSAKIALSGAAFPVCLRRWIASDTYCAHLRVCGEFDASKIQPTALEILRTFHPVK